ncbi:PREDICTED: 1-phosphatidylinositol 4,5-bisphosphate phosphodiesterase gamma-1-like isoform X4 [Branchiostoma belcheri]|uniref:1-phosphatidylinositol 4,5-bisphosphate phosphodiesterase gamma n=1 Tax=Branchiostoma belcheri TaxID=7741 RepID=A0A6P4ZIC8_BRABE|nr:PREDICTED: 1-phosphatidylinositol 4,5-bisphosphate phosphodiesterase gamma-1-like isoform X4 [Branchiostoma belcheri]
MSHSGSLYTGGSSLSMEGPSGDGTMGEEGATASPEQELTGQELNKILKTLELGTVLTKFFHKRKPENRTFQVKLETRQIVWSRALGRVEGSVDLREVKEIRSSKQSRDFERFVDEAKKFKESQCFVICYGTDFRMKFLSLVAISPEEQSLWVRGIRYLIDDTRKSPWPLQAERWLRKEFYDMDRNRSNTVTLKDIMAFLPKVNQKVSNKKELKEEFQKVDTVNKSEISFEQFKPLYYNLIHRREIEDKVSGCVSDSGTVTMAAFQKFVSEEQRAASEGTALNPFQLEEYVKRYLDDPLRQAVEPYFTAQEFLEYLFSRENSIFNEAKEKEVHMNMDLPFSNYWIASSHNTYLTGDQFSSDSSVESYVQVLRKGCRCVELDCWDGPDGIPVIYHGHTLTSKIKFLDVIRAVRDHAFDVSEYAVILSIENHCNIAQQRTMATLLKETFGEMLLTQPVDLNAMELPSPNQLKRKIIIKHKKLPDGSDDTRTSASNSLEEGREGDLSNALKNGILLLEDRVDRTWSAHFFNLTSRQLSYTEEQERRVVEDDDEEDEEEDEDQIPEDIPIQELHFSEPWFYGKVPGGRKAADKMLREYVRTKSAPDGCFLVRDSDTFVGDFSLTFWKSGRPNHCRIRSKQDQGKPTFYLIDNMPFDSLYSMVTYYRQYPLKANEFELVLTDPVEPPHSHEGKDWYNHPLSRAQAEEMLKRVRKDGAFLVRKSETDSESYAISFRAEGKIKHCRIKQDGRLYVIGTAQFESLIKLVNYYKENALYRRMKLRYAVNEEVVKNVGQEPEEEAIYSGPDIYMEPNLFMSNVKVQALYDYRAQRDDELSFCKHAIIYNVLKQDGGWWRGMYGGVREHKWFPSNYVEEMDQKQNSIEENPLGSLQQGVIDIQSCTVDLLQGGKGDQRWVFRIITPMNERPLEIAARSEEEMHEWVDTIRDAARMAVVQAVEDKDLERRKRIARELSDLVVYCRSVSYEEGRRGQYYEMSSFPETKMEKMAVKGKAPMLLEYNHHQLSRIYPKGQRIDSSNYDPMPLWSVGCQLVALNYQTPDRPMQLNEAMFQQNGRSGYILQPDCMRDPVYDPFIRNTLRGVDPITVTLTIFGGRHLPKAGRGIASPFVEVEIIGAEYDNSKFKTETVNDNGLNPLWTKAECEFDVANPEIAFLRFVVQDEDMFGDPNFLGQATYPVKSLRRGFRSVPLNNGHNEEIEMASLLVYIDICNAREDDDEDIYNNIVTLRDKTQILFDKVNNIGRDHTSPEEQNKYMAELRHTEEELLKLNEQRRARRNKSRRGAIAGITNHRHMAARKTPSSASTSSLKSLRH